MLSTHSAITMIRCCHMHPTIFATNEPWMGNTDMLSGSHSRANSGLRINNSTLQIGSKQRDSHTQCHGLVQDPYHGGSNQTLSLDNGSTLTHSRQASTVPTSRNHRKFCCHSQANIRSPTAKPTRRRSQSHPNEATPIATLYNGRIPPKPKQSSPCTSAALSDEHLSRPH